VATVRALEKYSFAQPKRWRKLTKPGRHDRNASGNVFLVCPVHVYHEQGASLPYSRVITQRFRGQMHLGARHQRRFFLENKWATFCQFFLKKITRTAGQNLFSRSYSVV
jgi:hypothetical protein